MNEELEAPVRRYVELIRELLELRKKTGDQDCPEEDALLDRLDVAWAAMTSAQCDRAEQILSVELGQREGS